MFGRFTYGKNFSKFEAALLIGLCTTLLYCLFCAAMQQSLSKEVLRLHVVANSDSGEDQRLKLCVRDAVLAASSAYMDKAENIDEAVICAEALQESIRSAAEDALRKAGRDDKIEVYLGKCEFPVKNYGRFTLPAGEYTALNVVIGDGAGHNWWCVMYPSLCTSPDPDNTLSESGLTAVQRRFMTSDGKYELRFRILDILRKIWGR